MVPSGVRIVRAISTLTRLWLAGIVLLAGACAHVESVPVAVVVPETAPTPVLPHKDAVAMVVSSNAPAYLSVARALADSLDRDYLRYSLESADPAIIRDIIKREQHQEVIAIGYAAAEAMRPIGTDRVIYCQVFYDADLHNNGFRGVSAVPPFGAQLAHWTELQPGLRRVGVVAGHASRDLIAQLKTAATEFGIEIRHDEVTSDKQALFVYQRMIPEIDGYLFLPDTAILSPTVIREMMRYGVKHNKSLLVYSPVLFELGGSVLVTPKPADVARQVMALLDATGRTDIDSSENPAPQSIRRELTDVAVFAPGSEPLTLAALQAQQKMTP